MDEENSTQTLYNFIYAYENTRHNQNVKRIRLAIRYFFIIPMILLAFMFFTGSSNIVFLMLWIVSLFGIAAYAIVIEYNDYELQKRMHVIEQMKDGNKSVDADALDMLPLINEREFQAFGIDRDSAGAVLSVLSHQKRQRRHELFKSEDSKAEGEAEKAEIDGGDTEKAAVEAEKTEKAPRGRKRRSIAAQDKGGIEKAENDGGDIEKAAVEVENTEKVAAEVEKTEKTADESADTEKAATDKIPAKKPRRTARRTTTPRKEEVSSESTEAEHR